MIPSILCWNIWGLNSPGKYIAMRTAINKYGIHMVYILEPWVKEKNHGGII